MDQKFITNSPQLDKENLKKSRLREIIKKRRLILEALVTKTEMLKVNLEMAKQEYMVSVGSLFIKDNQLDFEIIRLENIVQLMNQGYTQDEAEDKIAQNYYAQQEELNEEKEELNQEETIYHKREEKKGGLNNKLKDIWKKLIVRFHPDLTQDPDEKQKRDAIMKQINRAYQEGNYDQLLKIDHENRVVAEMTIDNLEEIFVRLSEEIRQQKKLYAKLKISEWYDWMIKIEKAKKKSINIFADTERRLLNDIVAKFAKIKKLKLQIQNFGNERAQP